MTMKAIIIDNGPDVWRVEVYTSTDLTFCFSKTFHSEVAMRAWLEEREEWLDY